MTLALAALLAAGISLNSLGSAQAQNNGFDPNRHAAIGMRQADRHNPFASGSVSTRPGTNYSLGATIIGGTFGFGTGYPYYGYPFDGGYPVYPYSGYSPYGGGYYPYYEPYVSPYYYGGYRRYPVMYPPVILPADALYGPRALERFFNGTNVNNNPPVIVNIDPGVNVPANNGNNNNANVAKPEPKWAREVSLAMRERAWRFMDLGDEAFREQDYRGAYEKYRSAARAAPRVVEAYLKQAQAMIALGTYDQALAAYGKALALPPLWATANFSLTRQYGDDAAGNVLKTKHLDQLAAAAEKDPNNADLMLLIGMELYYDQQPDRAVNFLRKAQQLGGQVIELPDQDALPPAADANGDDLPIPNPPPVGRDRRIF